MATGGYTPAAYRDSEDGEARPPAAPSFDWDPAPPAARTSAAPPAQSQAQQRLAAAAALVKKCADLGLPRPPLPHAPPPQQPPTRADQQQAAAVGQLAAATSQLQRQSGALVAALESQSAQLAAQQRLLPDVLQGMLFMAAKSAAHPAAPPAAPAAAATAAAAPGSSACSTAPAPAQQPPAAPVAQGSKPSLLLHDLANILAAQQAQQLGGRAAQPMPQIRPLLAGAQAAQAAPACMAAEGLQPLPPTTQLASRQPVLAPGSAGRSTPRLTLAAQLRMSNVQRQSLGEPGLEADAEATAHHRWQRPGRPRPEWDGRTVVPEPPRGSRGRAPRLDDPIHHRRRPRGATASLAAQLLEQELAKYRVKQQPRAAPPQLQQQQRWKPKQTAVRTERPAGLLTRPSKDKRAAIAEQQGGREGSAAGSAAGTAEARSLPRVQRQPAVQHAQRLQATAAEASALSGEAEGHITSSEPAAGAGPQPAPDAQHASPCGDSRQLASAGVTAACNCGTAAQPMAVVQPKAAAAAPTPALLTAAAKAERAAAISWLAAAGQPGDLAAASVSEAELLAVCGAAIEELLLGELLPCGSAQEVC